MRDSPNRANALGSIPLASLINTFKSGLASLIDGYVVAMNCLNDQPPPTTRAVPSRNVVGSKVDSVRR